MDDLEGVGDDELAEAVSACAETIEMLDKLVERKVAEVGSLQGRIEKVRERQKRYLAEVVRRKGHASA